MKSWFVIAAALAASGVAHADSLEDASLRQVTPQALGTVQTAPYFHGLATSEKTDWSIVLEAPRCYWFSGVSAPGAKELALYLWAPNGGARLTSERSESGQVTMAWCAQQSGMYKFQAKIDGKGEYVVGVFGKMPNDPSTAPPVELPRLAPPPPSPDLPPPAPIVVKKPAPIVVVPPPPPPPPPAPSGPPPWYKDGGAWALSAVGVASLVAGFVLVGTASSNFDYANSVAGDPNLGGPGSGVDGARSDGTAYAAAGAVALAVGTGLLVGGIVKFAKHPKEKGSASLAPGGTGRSFASAPLFSW